MIDPKQFRDYLLVPILNEMAQYFPGCNSVFAINLMIGTAWKESLGLSYLRQIGGGPAEGLCQVEPETEASLWAHHLRYNKDRRDWVLSMITYAEQLQWLAYIEMIVDGAKDEDVPVPNTDRLLFDLKYNLVMARMKYWVRNFSWPEDPQNIHALAHIWDVHYNVNKKHGFPHEFVAKFPAEIL